MNKLKRFVFAIYILWVFVNVYMLVFFGEKFSSGSSTNGGSFKMYSSGFDPKDKFFPFDYYDWSLSWDYKYYDYSEFFIYVIGPFTLFLIYKILWRKSIE
jgi:hypothetical protein